MSLHVMFTKMFVEGGGDGGGAGSLVQWGSTPSKFATVHSVYLSITPRDPFVAKPV